jgi:hypothetical protein
LLVFSREACFDFGRKSSALDRSFGSFAVFSSMWTRELSGAAVRKGFGDEYIVASGIKPLCWD